MTKPHELPDLENLARSMGELREEVTLLQATVWTLERRLDELRTASTRSRRRSPRRPAKAQGLRQDEVGDAPMVGPGRSE
jgi:hypothetical protein